MSHLFAGRHRRYEGIAEVYVDFLYDCWNDFGRLENAPLCAASDIAADFAIPAYADICDELERNIIGIALYESQLDRLFGESQHMAPQVRAYRRKLPVGRSESVAERYWATRPA
jgi:hypothetical protein